MNETNTGPNASWTTEMIEHYLEDRKKARLKEEEKRWRAIEASASLREILSSMTKTELSTIRTNLNIGNISTLKKQELVEALSERIPDYLDSAFTQSPLPGTAFDSVVLP